jgi:mRNA interferase MazF
MAGDLNLRRGDVVVAAAAGDYGKPRPNLVIQSNLFSLVPSVTICPFTSIIRDDQPTLRQTVIPSASNGLEKVSQIVIDKITTLPKEKIVARIGQLQDEEMERVNIALLIFLGLG